MNRKVCAARKRSARKPNLCSVPRHLPRYCLLNTLSAAKHCNFHSGDTNGDACALVQLP